MSFIFAYVLAPEKQGLSLLIRLSPMDRLIFWANQLTLFKIPFKMKQKDPTLKTFSAFFAKFSQFSV